MNDWGYELLTGNHLQEAVTILKLQCEPLSRLGQTCTTAWPKAYLKSGQKDLAIENYKKIARKEPRQRSTPKTKLKELESKSPAGIRRETRRVKASSHMRRSRIHSGRGFASCLRRRRVANTVIPLRLWLLLCFEPWLPRDSFRARPIGTHAKRSCARFMPQPIEHTAKNRSGKTACRDRKLFPALQSASRASCRMKCARRRCNR